MQTRVGLATVLMTGGLAGLAVLLGVRPAVHPAADPDLNLTTLFGGSTVAVLVGSYLFWTIGRAAKRLRTTMRELVEFQARGVALYDECVALGMDGEVAALSRRADAWDDEVLEWLRRVLPTFVATWQSPGDYGGLRHRGLSSEANDLAWGLLFKLRHLKAFVLQLSK